MVLSASGHSQLYIAIRPLVFLQQKHISLLHYCPLLQPMWTFPLTWITPSTLGSLTPHWTVYHSYSPVRQGAVIASLSHVAIPPTMQSLTMTIVLQVSPQKYLSEMNLLTTLISTIMTCQFLRRQRVLLQPIRNHLLTPHYLCYSIRGRRELWGKGKQMFTEESKLFQISSHKTAYSPLMDCVKQDSQWLFMASYNSPQLQSHMWWWMILLIPSPWTWGGHLREL